MSYEIADEPTPSEDLGKFVFEPSAPLLAAMVCGAWLAWPWFIVNSIALGSPTKRDEIRLCVVAVVGSAAMAAGLYALVDAGVIESKLMLQVGLLGITAFKLGMAYWVSTIQSRTFDVYTYYGGQVQNALAVLVIGSYLRDLVLGMSDSPIWHVIVTGGL
jgi:hypothetical protein